MKYWLRLLNNILTEQSFSLVTSKRKTYNDVHEQQMEYLKFLEANDLNYGRALFQPIWAGEYEYDLVSYGFWPDGQEQYKEWGVT